ncbi:MAG: hypothetical protein WKF97_03495 [Chitinophagaceae bacterium]
MIKALSTMFLLCLILTYCNSPKPITANPDNHTTTSGTLGSGRMTNSLPQKSDTAGLKPDTLPHRQ